jgi:ABC-type branched-subunit amino acid transport system substrate-binding protein
VITLTAAIPVVWGCKRTEPPAFPVSASRNSVAVLTPATTLHQIDCGRQIYLNGESPSGGKISGVLADSIEVPARLLACANCHGRDGRGGREGAIAPSDLTWTALTRPYGLDRPDGRHRPAYTKSLLTRAIAMGLDSGGFPLDRAMPRYRLSLEDNADLVGYLEHLELDRDPGVADDLIRIGVILPPNAESTGLGEAIRGILEGQVKEINDLGGVYHRRIIFRFSETSWESDLRQSVVRDMTSGSEPVFAILAANLGFVDAEIPSTAEREGVPLLGVVALTASDRPQPGRWVFFLLAGPDDQAFALARLALRDGPTGAALAIVHGQDAGQRALAVALCARLRSAGLASPVDIEISGAPGSLGAVSQFVGAAEVIVMLGPAGRSNELLSSLASRNKLPTILFPGTLADRNVLDLPSSFDRRVQLALSIAPSDQTVEGLARFQRLSSSRRSSGLHRTAQLGSLAAADVLIEGLRRAGRGLTRERFVAELERMRDFHTGLSPAITFNPNRHVGATGAHAITLDLLGHRLLPNGPWIDASGPLPPR